MHKYKISTLLALSSVASLGVDMPLIETDFFGEIARVSNITR